MKGHAVNWENPAGRPARWRRAAALLAALSLTAALGCQKSLDDRLEDVRALHDLGAWEESVEELRDILQEHPEQLEANYLLGVAQLRLGQPSLAIWPLQLATRDPELAKQAELAVARAYLQLDQTEAALEAADRVLTSDPGEPERIAALELRAQANLAAKDNEAVLEDAERLLALRPDHTGAQAMRANALLAAGRAAEAEEPLRAIWEKAGAGPAQSQAAAQAGLGLARLYQTELDDPAAAEKQLAAVLDRFPAMPMVVRFAAAFYDEQEQEERGTEVLYNALEVEPADLGLRSMVAETMAARGHPEEGDAIMVEGTELLGSASAWLGLAQYRRKQGEHETALEAMERVVELVPETNDQLRFHHGDLLASTGHLDRAQAVAEQLSDSVYRDVLLGRLAFERGQYERALELLDQGLRRWPNNAGARYLAGRAALALGDTERAMSELREAVRVAPGATDAGIDMAHIHLARGEPALAAAFAGRAVGGAESAGGDRLREALVLYARASTAAGRIEEARRAVARLAGLPDGQVPATVELGAAMAQVQGPAAAAKVLAAADLDLSDPANVEVLRALGQYLVEAGRADAALERVQAALDEHPDVATLHDAKGRVLFNAGRVEEARTAFERALEIDPELAPALEGLAQVARVEGDLSRARELFVRAAEADPARDDHHYGAAQLALMQGDGAAAEAHLRDTLRRNPFHLEANNDLAWILAQRGESLDEALERAQRAATGLGSAAALDTLGWVQLRRGEAEKAAETLEKAHELAPESPSITYRLGLAVAETGASERARELLRSALAAPEPFPEAERARERLAQLDAGAGT